MRELKVSLLAAFLFSLLCSNLVYSQDKTAEYNPLAENKWAVVFEVGNIFKNYETNGIYKSYTVNCKYHFSKKTAIRLMVGTDGDLNEGSGVYDYTDIIEKKRQSFQMETSIQGVYYLKSDTRIKVFACFGPYLTVTNEYKDAESNTGSNFMKENTNKWGLGVSVSFGVEYFILDNISLIGEYFASATAGKNNNWLSYYENGETYFYDKDFTEYKYNVNKMRLGLSVYF